MMAITAVYEKGVLRPTRRLNLREQQEVHICILTQKPQDETGTEAEVEQELARILQSLVDACVLAPPAPQTDVKPMSEQERQELADEMGKAPGKPLLEIIIEHRGEWHVPTPTPDSPR
jgi:predicted DNA-binding antitoxin AbrB/MazE fold protein